MTLEKYLTKNFEIFFREYPLFGPPKCGVAKNDHPSTAYDPTFLLQNPFPHKKCGCLQKTRAQSVKIWPRYKGLKWKKNIFKNFHFFDLQTKNAINQRVFKIFPNFFSSTWSVITPYSICGSTLILGGIKKPKYSCGSWESPQVIIRIQNPGSQRFKQ